MGRISHDNRLAAFAVGFAVCCGTGLASAADGAANRHPSYLLSPAHKPAGVPVDYVLTHNGFFHPSCVVTVGSDEVVGADLVIRGRDGSEHARVTPCAYPRYDRHGVPVASAEAPPVHAAAALYDGYIVYYAYDGKVPVGPTLTTDWTVPLAPKTVSDQDIAFFNDIVTTAGGGDILQPVLDFNGEVRNHWAVESEHCCIANNDMQTTPVDVNAGDQIRGTVVGSNCTADGVCQNWAVTTADITTGGTTTLNTTAPMGVPNGVSPCALETYGVTSCDMFPASGEVTFVDNQLTSATGTTELKYHLLVLDGVNAEVPRTCGYTGTNSGDDYTLIFGALTAGGAGGVSGSGGQGGTGGASAGASGRNAGGASGTSVGGHGGSGGATDIGGANNAGGAGAGGVAGSSNAAGQTSTGVSGAPSGGAFNGGGASGAETGTSAGTAGSSTTSAGQANTNSASDSTGCSCKLGSAQSTPSAPLAPAVALLVAGLALARRRKSN